MIDQQAEVVPRGEREDLQRTAQATGERLGRQDTRIEGHDDHFRRFNGSVARIGRVDVLELTLNGGDGSG